MGMTIIEARNISKVYRRGIEEIHALKDVNFAIAKGEFISIVGPSGSGKTTLLNIIGCLDTPTKGTLIIDGITVTGKKEKELVNIRRNIIGFVFQQYYLIPTLTVQENIELPLLFSRKKPEEERINTIIRRIGLENRANHLPHELSGGEMQRVAIGRSIVNEPKVLFADEPTGNLDSRNALKIYNIFSELNRQGLTLIIVTHNKELAGHAGKVVSMKDGVLELEPIK